MGEASALPATLPDGDALRPLILSKRLADLEAGQAADGGAEAGGDGGVDAGAVSRAVSRNGARVIREATWRAMEAAKKSGQAKMVGVSNYPAQALVEMLEYGTDVMPAVNQVTKCVSSPRRGSSNCISCSPTFPQHYYRVTMRVTTTVSDIE